MLGNNPYGLAKALNKTKTRKATIAKEPIVPASTSCHRIVVVMFYTEDASAILIERLFIFVCFHFSLSNYVS